jgi:thiol-disulfide isomerase/thioredoxin
LVVAVARADDPQRGDAAASEGSTAASPADRLKESPNDTAVLNQYMGENLRRVSLLMNSEPQQAEQLLTDMKKLLDSLEPDAEAAKQLLERAKSAVAYFEQQLELARTSLEELGNRLKENPDDAKTVSTFLSKVMQELSPLTRSEPDKAEKELKAARELLATVGAQATEDAAKKMYERAEQAFGRLESSIETGKRLAALVGQDSVPLEVEAWVNGTPLTDADLKAKVVLLDFWSVWCGPCISTFPHLREWHEKYADKGLIIIGLTRYYNYVWDDQQGRPKRSSEKVSPEQEQEMLQKFAEHHNLHHRFAIQKDSTLSDYYAVSGIPHVVVIDREGKIRLIRIGSGEKNAQDIGSMIESLIAEGTTIN